MNIILLNLFNYEKILSKVNDCKKLEIPIYLPLRGSPLNSDKLFTTLLPIYQQVV